MIVEFIHSRNNNDYISQTKARYLIIFLITTAMLSAVFFIMLIAHYFSTIKNVMVPLDNLTGILGLMVLTFAIANLILTSLNRAFLKTNEEFNKSSLYRILSIFYNKTKTILQEYSKLLRLCQIYQKTSWKAGRCRHSILMRCQLPGKNLQLQT